MINKCRKEVQLHEDVINRLQKLADRKKWSLKRYMEHVLENDGRKVLKEELKRKVI